MIVNDIDDGGGDSVCDVFHQVMMVNDMDHGVMTVPAVVVLTSILGI